MNDGYKKFGIMPMIRPTAPRSGLLSRFEDPSQQRLAILIARSLAVVLVLAALIAVGLFVSGDLPRTADGTPDFGAMMQSTKDSVWAPVVVIAIYVLLNFAGIPQFLLVGATVVVFGPWLGFANAWIATMASSSVGFWLGHFFGGEILRRFAGDRANRFSHWLGRHGILASAIVRVVPAGPALGVNMAAGVSHISYAQFLIGTALGIAPKIALIAALGQSLQQFVISGDTDVLVITALSIVAWIAMMIVGRRVYTRWRARQARTGGVMAEPPAADAAPQG